jgi:protein TonB
VVLRLVVAGDGTVKDVSVISGNQFLTQAAMDAARQWLYKPTLLNGAPVEVLTEATINFRLSGQ